MARQLADFLRWYTQRHLTREHGLALACLLLCLLSAWRLWSAQQEHDRLAASLAYQQAAQALHTQTPAAAGDITPQLQRFFEHATPTPEFLRQASQSAKAHAVELIRVTATERKQLAHDITSQRIVMALEGSENGLRDYAYDLLARHPNLALDKLVTTYRKSGQAQAELTLSHLNL